MRLTLMLPIARYGDHGLKLFLIHWLSGSARVWQELGGLLAERGVQCIGIDLPGFGNAAGVAGYSVAAMCEAVAATIQAVRAEDGDEPWLLAGHSMGGRVASVVARSAADGSSMLKGLQGLVLFSPSPPGPEPMKESKREHLLSFIGEASGNVKKDRQRAAEFVQENTGKLPLPESVQDRAVEDVLRMNRTAFRAWLEHGSREDWRSVVGALSLPALIFAGSEEEALGPEAQRDETLPHFNAGQLVVLQGAGHLAPLERPMEVAEHLSEFVQRIGLRLRNEQELGPHFSALLHSTRTSAATREAMQKRLTSSEGWNYTPRALDPSQFRTVRAVAARIVPNAGFDLAAGIDMRLAQGRGDGWRPELLSEDLEAWKRGLRSLDGAATHAYDVPFISLHPAHQDELLRRSADGSLGKGLLGALGLGATADAYTADQMKLWFEEVRGTFAKAYMAHPATMERVGFTGFADEGGFTQLRVNEKEIFEA